MTAIPSFAFQDMDSLHHDDKMDLASSPYRQLDDLDIELDPIHEPSVEPNHQDNMADDTADPQEDGIDTMQADDHELLHDDDMLDGAASITDFAGENDDFNMEAYQEEFIHGAEDDDILYEEEDGIEDTTEDIGGDVLDVSQEMEAGAGVQQAEAGYSLEDVQEEFLNEEGEDIAHADIQPANKNYEDSGSAGDEYDLTAQIPIPTEPTSDSIGIKQQPSGDNLGEPEDEIPSTNAMESKLPGSIASETNRENDVHDDLKPQEPEPSADDINSADAEPREEAELKSTDSANENGVVEHDDPTQVGERDLGFHPVKVVYQGAEICLFPPTQDDASETFFLTDVSLAYESLDKLLSACREILTGTIGDDDELVLDVASLGLHICEDSKYATQITLSQIVDVYLALSHNDNAEQIEPLYCSLTSRVCLASQYAYLSAAAGQGKTFAEIASEHLDSPEGPEDYDEINAQAVSPHDLQEADEAEVGTQFHDDQDIGGRSASAETNIPKVVFDSNVPVEELGAHGEQDGPREFGKNGLDDEGHQKDNDVTGNVEEYEKSATSTIRGDELESKGDYDPGFEIWIEPDHGAQSSFDANAIPDDPSKNPLRTSGESVEKASHSFQPKSEKDDAPADALQQGEYTVNVHEAGSVVGGSESSHTVEADGGSYNGPLATEEGEHLDFAESSLSDSGEDPGDFEDFFQADLDDDAAERHIDYQIEDPSGQESEEELGVIGEDELFDFDQELKQRSKVQDISYPTRGEGSANLEDAANPEAASNKTSSASADEKVLSRMQSTTIASWSNIPAPMTPTGKSIKRKLMEDEDEFDLLDATTPETKRRRPS